MDSDVKEHLLDWASLAYPIVDLVQLPTRADSGMSDLKVETVRLGGDGRMYRLRIWLNRVSPEDGAVHPVELEVKPIPGAGRRWETVGGYGRWQHWREYA